MRKVPQYQDSQPTQAQAPFGYVPFPQRQGAADQFTFQQPIPKATGWYMTFWAGNQLPGVHIETAPSPSQNFRYQEQHSAQRAGGGFGGGWMNAVTTFNLLERIRSAWASQSGY